MLAQAPSGVAANGDATARDPNPPRLFSLLTRSLSLPSHTQARRARPSPHTTMGVDDEHGPAVGDDFVYSTGLTTAGK